MTDPLAALAARLAAIEDRENIRDLVARYGPLADCGDASGVAGLWTEDGSYEIAGFAVATGRTAIAALIKSSEHQALLSNGCAHLLGPLAIDLDGDTATARGHSIVFRHCDDGFSVYRVAANRWTFARTGDGWKVVQRVNRLLDGHEVARALLASQGQDSSPRVARHRP